MLPFLVLDFDGWGRVCRRGSIVGLLLLLQNVPLDLGIGLPGVEKAHAFADNEQDDPADDAAPVDAGEEQEEEPKKISTSSPSRASFSPQATTDLAGVNGRIGHLAFPTFGRNDSISHVELLPFVIVDNEMLFGDARLFTDNSAQFGGNGGAGYRRWVPAWERVFGASLWYDFDEGSGKSFQQTGLSVESYGQILDFRGNGYLPVGETEKEYYKRFSQFRYDGNQVVFDYLRKYAQAQAGFDLEMGLAVPSKFAEDRNLRVFGGYYHFLGDDVPDISGYKARVEGNLTDSIDVRVELTDDNAFGTNVNFGVAYSFGAAPNHSPTADKKLRQLTRYVNRNYNIIVTRQEDNSYHRPAINPADGQPYMIQHVSSAAAGPGTGTPEDPFQTIAGAQAGNPDVILVHSGSVLSDSVVLASNQRILGEGVPHLINVQGKGNVLLPSFTGGTILPIFQGTPGDAVTLASGSEFSGFVIDGPAGVGIAAGGVANAIVRNATIQNALGDGIFLTNPSGPVLFENVNLAGIGGTAFHVNGGNSDVQFLGTITNTAGGSVTIENTAGGTVNLENVEIVDNGGTGIRIADNAGNISFGNVDVQNSTAAGIDVRGGTGTTLFTKQTTLVNSAGPAINIENAGGTTNFNLTSITNATGAPGVRIVNSAAATTTFSNLNLSTQAGTGLFAQNGGTLGIFGGAISATNASALDLENTTMDIDVTSVSSTNAATGIRIVNSPGGMIVRGDGTNNGSGGLIQGAGVGVLIENAGPVAFQSMILDGNATGLMAANTESLYFHLGQITNSTGHGIDLLNVRAFELYGSSLNNNAAGSLRAQFDVPGDYNYVIQGNAIDSTTASPIVLTTLPSGNNSTLSLNMQQNTITLSAAGSQALDLDWNGALVSTIVGNTVTATGVNSTGFDLNAGSATQLAQLAIGQNAFTFAGNGSTGTRITTSGPSQIDFGENSTVFNAANGIGVDFAIGQSSTIDIFSNVFTDNVSRGTGVLFSSIAGTSTVTIDNNAIQLLSADGFVDRGIIFNSVTGNVQLKGTRNNSITGATTPFSAVGTTGQILVNGLLVP